ncbi:ADP-dependent NAD(P)H-hydrate dehydratase [Microcella sp.]|uniref:ADP-dependent NAD(P)H-hydrate dehydratase n=1 Tax=Microcella sp. TaxID=1913979 RepID=UPI0025D968B3|nr:ADP/ATP-dependent (S)-NAD(P)H-hydrate dehydratase [Microcella sp.]
MTDAPPMTPAEAGALIKVPRVDDDKYSRGVVGFVTGSTQYPGAAVLGVEAALRTGVGMARYLGPPRATELVLQRRPEAVTAEGRVQAWVVGSGIASVGDLEAEPQRWALTALASGHPTVTDAGAIERDAVVRATAAGAPVVITPHAGELARLLDRDREAVHADPVGSARDAAHRFGVVVLLKGSTTRAVSPSGHVIEARSAPAWLATAGAGDALAGLLGALLAAHADALAADEDRSLLTRLAAAAAVIHGLAAERASAGGPLTVLDLCAAISPVLAQLVADRS